MKRTTFGAVLLAGALFTALLTSCSDSDGSGTASRASSQTGSAAYPEGMFGDAQSPGAATTGGTLDYAAYGEPRSLDPAVSIAAATTGGIEMTALYDTLLRFDSGKNNFVPQLAEAISPNTDFTEWTLTLRDGTQFSDGTALDSASVKASQERYVAASGPESALWKANVSEIGTPDAATVVYTLKRPWGSFPASLSTGMGMIVAQTSGPAGEKFTPVGAGAFTLDQWRRDESLQLTANPKYWNGKPPLDGLRVVYLSGQTTARDSLVNGDVDAAYFRDPDLVDEVLAAGYGGHSDLVAASRMALINAKEGRPGADPRVRKAMQLAISPDLIRERVYKGHGIVSPLIFPEFSSWHAPEVDALEPDPAAAKQLLDAAKADGYDGKITYLEVGDAAGQNIAQTVQAALQSVGFTVETELLPTSTDVVRRIAAELDYDVSSWGANFRESDPFSKMFAMLHSAGSQTYGMATSAEMDAALEELQAAPDAQTGKAAIAKIQTIWNGQVPFLNWMPMAEVIAWNDQVHGVRSGSNSNLAFDQAWIAK